MLTLSGKMPTKKVGCAIAACFCYRKLIEYLKSEGCEMKKQIAVGIISAALSLITVKAAADKEIIDVEIGENGLVSYQAYPMRAPQGGDSFKGSNFIHPLKTPSGFVVTDLQPEDHLHHFGLWWPWKYVEVEGRKILCWELQRGDGVVRAQGGELTADGFSSKSVYVDRKSPGGARAVLNETLRVKVSEIIEKPARGYNVDFEIIHAAIDKKVIVTKYRYSGFSLRGSSFWNKDNCVVLTSAGENYADSNFTRAKWVRVEGSAGDDKKAGILIMSHSQNRDHPELLRTWNPKTHNGAVFVNFNTVLETSWEFLPGKKYLRNFRVFVYDGTLSQKDAERMWKKYHHPGGRP